MSDIVIPNLGQNKFLFNPLDQQIYINGERRTDIVCTDCTLQSGTESSNASLWFPHGKYDSQLVNENDIVEVVMKNFGVIFRGYITSRKSSITDRIVYTALCYGEKFNDIHFYHEYNYLDEITGELQYPYTIKQIAMEAYQLYATWQSINCPDDFALDIDLESFPDISPKETNITSQPLIQGLQQLLDDIDYRYRIRIYHDDNASTIQAYLLGEGYIKQINRGTDVSVSYYDQPDGIATVSNIDKSVNASNVLNYVYAVGDKRVVETAFTLGSWWNEVPNDFTPPEGYTLQDFVTVAERDKVINNWEKYTTPLLDIKAADKFNYKLNNSNYRKKYEYVCTHWYLPRWDESYYFEDDPLNYPNLITSPDIQPKIETDLVQQFTDNDPLKHFIVFKRFNDDTIRVKFDGFDVKDSKLVVFEHPFVDKVSNVVIKGNYGSYVDGSYNNTTSQYSVANDNIPDFVTYITVQNITDGLWLVLGEYPSYYKIKEVDQQIITVYGNLTDCGVDDGNGNKTKGNDWFIVNKDPFYAYGQSGTGGQNGTYEIDTGQDETLTNQYTGMYLVLGNYNANTDGFMDLASDLKIFRIAYSSSKYLFVDQKTKDLTGYPQTWTIVNIQKETKRPFEWVALNTAYDSTQKLAWLSDDLAPEIANKRQVNKVNTQFKWTTESNNYQLIKYTQEGMEDQFSVVFNPTVIDHLNQKAELISWATNQVKGSNDLEIQYSISIRPFDFNIQVSDRLYDNRIDSGATVTGIKFDFTNYQMDGTAASWQ